MMMTPLPSFEEAKPGSATNPLFGVEPALVDNEGNTLDGATEGNLIIKRSWPGQARTIWGDHERLSKPISLPILAITHWGRARRDEDGHY